MTLSFCFYGISLFLKFPKSCPNINKPLTTIPNTNNVHKIPKQNAQLPMKNEYFYNKDFSIASVVEVVEDILSHIMTPDSIPLTS